MVTSRLKRLVYLALTVTLLIAGCQSERSSLNPRGEGAQSIANLWMLMLLIGTIVYSQVVSVLIFALFRRREETDENAPPDKSPTSRNARLFILANGFAIPLAILTVVIVLNFFTLLELSPEAAPVDLTIDVIGHRYWWEVRYEDQQIVTANEIHIPTNARVRLRLTSEDVIHSFWVPALNGKADLIPGQTNQLILNTPNAGEYYGQCAELCGLQHAGMLLKVIAAPQSDFEAWVAEQQKPAITSEDGLIQRGEQIFLGAACVYCHQIRGTGASGVIGPDLTHIGSRTTLAAGVIPNNTANLAGWIVDPQSIKPGNLMPPMYLEGDDLQALVAYLQSLR